MINDSLPVELERVKRLCVFCNESLAGFCGSWRVYTSGCCVGAVWQGTKYLFRRGSHVDCYLESRVKGRKFRPKLMLTEKEVKSLLKKVKRK